MSDPLFNVLNHFHCGAYQLAINAAQELDGLPPSVALERDCIVYRAYLALGNHQLVCSDVTDSAPTALQAVKQLALYMSSEAQRASALAALDALVDDAAVGRHPQVLLCCASAHALEGDYPRALSLCHGGSPQHLELLALSVQVLLAMNRSDVAERSVAAMSALDDDATLTQLAGAWVHLSRGGGKAQDAMYTCQELGDKYCWTPKLHVAAACAYCLMGQHDEGERHLAEALTLAPNDPDVIANLVVAAMHLGRRSSPKVRTWLAQLKSSGHPHPLLAKQTECEAAFEAAVAALEAA